MMHRHASRRPGELVGGSATATANTVMDVRFHNVADAWAASDGRDDAKALTDDDEEGD